MHSSVPLHVVVLGEARDVLCELRGNRRFGYLPSFVSASPTAEHPLVTDVKRVRDTVRTALRGHPNTVLSPHALAAAIEPFLRIVQSRDTSGNITGVALLSLDRISLSVLALPSALLPDYTPVLSSIVSAAATCKFDQADPSKDEVVLARIVRLIARIAASPAAAPRMSDAALLQGFEACLAIASGRRRTTDLLKRTADATLFDIADALASALAVDVDIPSATPGLIDLSSPASSSSVAISEYLAGGSYGYAFDVDAHLQSGPASAASVAAILELASKLADPAVPRAHADRILGLQLVNAILAAGGTKLRSNPRLRRLLVRETTRAILRAVGSFHEPPVYISAAFNAGPLPRPGRHWPSCRSNGKGVSLLHLGIQRRVTPAGVV
jgi:hypothetical protein